MSVKSYNAFSKQLQGPTQHLTQLSVDALKLLRRGVSWGIKPPYRQGLTLREVDEEIKRRMNA